jgi:hypothetical protein
MAKRKSESLAGSERLMEEVCELENCKQALLRVKGNKGSPGVDGMTVDELPEYLKQHELEIGEQLRSGTYQPQPVRRVEMPKPDGRGMRKLGIPCVLERFVTASGHQPLNCTRRHHAINLPGANLITFPAHLDCILALPDIWSS